MRIAILGGGVAGVVLARELSRSNATIDLYEQQPALGGLQRSVEVNGLHYDIGSFLFPHDHELLRTFPSLQPHFVEIDHRSVVLTRHNSLDLYPMTMRGYLRDHTFGTILPDGISLLAAKLRHRRRDTMVAYVKYYLGDRVYRKSGLKAYIERFYDTPDTDVDLAFALQRLDALPAECGLRRNIFRIVREAFNSRALEGGAWRCFIRPPQGFSFVYGIIEQELRHAGVHLLFNTPLERIERDRGAYLLYRADGRAERYDAVVSTIPIGAAMGLIGRPMQRPPQGVGLVSLCYRFRGSLGFGDARILYNFTYDGLWKRINVFSSLYGQADGDDYFMVECTQRERRHTAEDYRRDFEAHAARLPIFHGELRYQGAIETENAYPYFRVSDMERTAAARAELKQFGIVLTGRQGTFAYQNAHITALMARATAREMMGTPPER